MVLRSCEMDVRVGGRYRLVFGHDASNPDEFFGRYLEVIPHSRLVWTNDEAEDGGPVTTLTLEEKAGKGAYDGMSESFAQLDELLVG